jgi:integrase
LHGEPGSPEFIASYNAAVATKMPDNKAKKLSWLIRDYQASGHFQHKLSERTREDYRKLLAKIEDKFGDMPLKATDRKETRGILMRWRDELSMKSPRQADYTFAVLSAVFNHGFNYGEVRQNPCAMTARLYNGTRVDRIWTTEDIAAFLQAAPPHLHLPLLIALWTGQRQGDILRLPWSAYDGQFIRLRPRKSDRNDGSKPVYLSIPVGEPLKVALDAAAKTKQSPRILLNEDGRPWQEKHNGFRSSWRKASIKAGVQGRVAFTDLRGTAVTRLALVGCSVPQICTFTGHKAAEVNQILEAHYLHRDPQLALDAIRKLEMVYAKPVAQAGA